MWQHPLFPINLGSRNGVRQGKIRLIHDASSSGMCGLPSSLQARYFEVSLGPVLQQGLGFCTEEICSPLCPVAKQRRCVPYPRGGSGTLCPKQPAPGTAGVCSVRYEVPEGVPSAHSVCHVRTCGGAPCTCLRFFPIKNCWSKSRSPSASLDVGYWVGAARVAVSSDDPSPEL